MSRRKEIEELREQLQRRTIVAQQIEKKISELEEQEGTTTADTLGGQRYTHKANSRTRSQRSTATTPPEDRFGTPINIGDRVTFLTKGKFKSTEGVVTRFSKNKERVFARDSDQREIPRAPCNVEVQK